MGWALSGIPVRFEHESIVLVPTETRGYWRGAKGYLKLVNDEPVWGAWEPYPDEEGVIQTDVYLHHFEGLGLDGRELWWVQTQGLEAPEVSDSGYHDNPLKPFVGGQMAWCLDA